MKKILGITLCLVLVFSFAATGFAEKYKGKKILYVDSYHEGYPWSDGITKGVKAVLENMGVELKIIRMDTKKNTSEEFKKQAALKAKAVIEEFKPDVVIASDDNASKYLIVPYYKDANLPFVFCGVNWDASVYGFPFSNVTGMVEVNDIVGLVDQLKKLSKGEKVGFMGGDTLTNRKEVENYKRIFNLDVEASYPKSFEDWKKDFIEIQNRVQNLVFYNFVAIERWNEAEAIEFVQNNTKIPTGTFQEGPMPYVLVGYLKVAQEQGRWAANAALKILDGTSPSDISITKNEEGKLMLNAKLAEKMGIEFPYDLIEATHEIIE
jgi:ABC-type uncharacterized transport system substrate-binding protein